jgi:hypothetical protein
MLKNLTSMEDIIRRQNSEAISCQVSPASLLSVSAGNCQSAQVDKSGIIRNKMVTHYRSEMVVKQGTPCEPMPQHKGKKTHKTFNVGCLPFAVLRDFRALYNIYEYVCCYIFFHGMVIIYC